MTRIAYLTSQYPATSHTFIRREVEALRRAGVDIATFSIRQPSLGERSAPENREAFETTTYIQPPRLIAALRAHLACLLQHPLRYARTLVDALRHRVPGISATLYSFIYFAEAIVLANAVRQQRITHLHNHFANAAAIVGYLATRFLGIEHSLTLHGISEFDYPAGLLLREKLKHARFVACASHFCRAQALRSTDPDDWSKMMIVRCGIDTERFAPVKPTPRTGRVRVLHVGRLSAEKGQSGLISAFSRLREQGIDAELRIVGTGPIEAALKAQALRMGLQDACVFLGRQDEGEIVEELHHADVFAMSSLMEGLPVVLMEAMACGVAVVAPCVAGIPELVVHGETGLLYAPGDWDDLGRQLAVALQDPEQRRRLADSGRQHVLAHFDIETAVLPLVRQFTQGPRREAPRH